MDVILARIQHPDAFDSETWDDLTDISEQLQLLSRFRDMQTEEANSIAATLLLPGFVRLERALNSHQRSTMMSLGLQLTAAGEIFRQRLIVVRLLHHRITLVQTILHEIMTRGHLPQQLEVPLRQLDNFTNVGTDLLDSLPGSMTSFAQQPASSESRFSCMTRSD